MAEERGAREREVGRRAPARLSDPADREICFLELTLR